MGQPRSLAAVVRRQAAARGLPGGAPGRRPGPRDGRGRGGGRARQAALRSLAGITRAAQYLNSGILPKGSSAGLVRVLAAASA